MHNVAVVLAGGTGQRMGLEIPKQLVKIAGKPIMQHTLQIFQSAPQIDEIIVAMTPGFAAEAEAIVAAAGCTKVSHVIEGGATRTETTMRAIETVSAARSEANVLFHDAVRPFIDHRVIEDCVTALDRYEAVDVAIPSADTIIKVDDYGGTVIKDVPRRDLLRRGQTPQCFRLSTIQEAYRLALADPDFTGGKVSATDDCSVVLRYLPDVPIVVVPGSEQNMKVTHPVDVFLADKLFQLSSQAPPPPLGTEKDYAGVLSGKTIVIFGGSQGIGADIAGLAESFGARVYAFSRSETGTHVENMPDIETALAKAHGETGRIDYVVNTAGVLHTGRLDEVDESIVEESLRVNYMGPLQIARAAIGYLRETKGQLLLYTSSSYTRGRAGYSLYSSAKAATVNLTQALADEWAEDGVRVNCINPERTATPMRTRAFGQEPADTLLSSNDVALTSIDVLISALTGHTVDIRRQDPSGGRAMTKDRLLGVILILSYPATVVAALWPSTWGFAVAALAGYVADALASREDESVTERLAQVNAGITVRFMLREVALLLLLVREGYAADATFAALALGLLGLHGLRGAYSALTLFVIRRRRLPAVTRGMDLSELRIPDAPHPALTTRHSRTMLHLDVPVVVGALFSVRAGLSGMATAYVLGLVAVAVMAQHALRNRHLGNENRVFDVVNRRLAELRPEVALYFSGSLDSAYQANMWLSTIDDLDHRAVILLRERAMVPLLGRTRTPVLCVPKAMDVVRLDLSTIRCALYPANVGKNLHMLRMSGIRSAFINHGDSDKPASFNPFARAYDEVWVAGPAGRDRYLTMRTGVRDEDIVEVGRPQLALIDSSGVTSDPMFTVLYAPTWEGWSDDLAHSSVNAMGPAIVRALLDHAPQVRVLYKPHPLTGTRDAQAIERHQEIVAMIERANRTREASGGEHSDRLKTLTRHLDALAGDESAGDEAQISRDTAGATTSADWRETEDAWTEAYWQAGGPLRHRVVTGQRPHVYDCFNHADLLITDISSVAGDFIVSGKPYAVTNVAGLDAEEFRRLYPTAAAAAYLVGPDCAELPAIVAQAQSGGPDPLAGPRRELRNHLLGPDELDAGKRFDAAVSALSAKSLPHDERPEE